MENNSIEENIEILHSKNTKLAYKVLKELQEESQKSECIYRYMDKFIEMMNDENSYIRTRGLTLIAENARWDSDFKIDEIIDNYLKHIIDVKPITARQCIKQLPLIARFKSDLRKDIVYALQHANTTVYADSMQPLIYKDIQAAVKEIDKL